MLNAAYSPGGCLIDRRPDNSWEPIPSFRIQILIMHLVYARPCTRNMISIGNTTRDTGLRLALIVATTIVVMAVLVGGAMARSGQSTRPAAKRAVISGWVLFAGGSHGRRLPRRSGTVIVRTESGHFVTSARATEKHGFRLSLKPGRYKLSAVITEKASQPPRRNSCPVETKVKLHAGINQSILLASNVVGTGKPTPPALRSPRVLPSTPATVPNLSATTPMSMSELKTRVTAIAAEDGDPDPFSIETAEVLPGQATAVTISGISAVETAQNGWPNEPAYAVVLHGHFERAATPGGVLPECESRPKKPYTTLSLVLNARTGAVSRFSLTGASQGQPTISELGGVTVIYRRELPPASAAEAALREIQESAKIGKIALRVAHGTFAQAKAILNGQRVPASPTKTRCYPPSGSYPTVAEVERFERERREQDEGGAYIVEMTGTTFYSERTRRGSSQSSGAIETVIVDACSGDPESLTIGGKRVKLKGIGPVTKFTAVLHRRSSSEVVTTIVSSSTESR